MSDVVLGIETSCDETAAAVVERAQLVRSSVVSSQVERHAPFGGVVPEIAGRAHVEQMVPVIAEALVSAGAEGADLDAVAATTGPGLAGSLLIGVSAAKALSLVWDVPFVSVNHLEAHLYASFLEEPDLELPLVVLLVSGGHTMLVLMEDHCRYRLLGSTLDDAAGEVRFQSIWALGQMADQLSPEQVERLQEHSRRLATDANRGAKREATIRVESFVDAWIQEARRLSIRGQLAEAESLFAMALAYSPSSKRANYRMARFYFDNHSQEKGLQLLRQHGMVLDAPRLSEAPVMDGRLDEPLWQQAACADTFFQYSSEHFAAVPSDVGTRICVAYGEEDLYFGFLGYDSAPDSIVARISARDDALWHDDILEIFIDSDFDLAHLINDYN